MRIPQASACFGTALLFSLLVSCRDTPGRAPEASAAAGKVDVIAVPDSQRPLVLALNEGERRVRRVMGGAVATIKVDRRNGGSPDLVMGFEELPPGQTIAPHQHAGADEIIFVHRGQGVAELGARKAEVAAGTTIYIPRSTRVTLTNTGTEPLAVAFVFSKPGYEEYMRATSVPEGTQTAPLTPAELQAIRARHRHAIEFDTTRR
jgi:quercetin dioxygenase-like cupin family protein